MNKQPITLEAEITVLRSTAAAGLQNLDPEAAHVLPVALPPLPVPTRWTDVESSPARRAECEARGHHDWIGIAEATDTVKSMQRLCRHCGEVQGCE